MQGSNEIADMALHGAGLINHDTIMWDFTNYVGTVSHSVDPPSRRELSLLTAFFLWTRPLTAVNTTPSTSNTSVIIADRSLINHNQKQ